MKLRKAEIILIILTLASFVGAYFVYPYMPEMVASHWNATGEVDDYMSQFWGTLIWPIIASFLTLIFLIIPRIDPLKSNIKDFRGHFDNFIILLFLAMGAISGFAYAWNLGYQFEISYVVIPAISIIIFYSGVLSKNAKQNWSIGFRTPWALSDKDNWTKTNRLGGTLFQISAVLMTLSLLFSPAVSFIVTMFALFGSVITSYTYSYLIFRK